MSMFSTSVNMTVSFATYIGVIVSGDVDDFLSVLSGMVTAVVVNKCNRFTPVLFCLEVDTFLTYSQVHQVIILE